MRLEDVQRCPQVPAPWPQALMETNKGRWEEEEEEEEEQDLEQRRGQRQQRGDTARCSAQHLWEIHVSLSPARLFSHRAISVLGAAFQLQQETIKKSVLFLVQERCW